MQLKQVGQTSEEQKHQQDIQAIVARGNRIFSCSVDGVVKVWNLENLKLEHEFKAHDYSVNHLMLLGDRLYSVSMDLTIKAWQLDTWKLVSTFSGHEGSPMRLATDGEFVYSGDDNGEVIKWTKDGKEVVRYGVVEEVWDLSIQGSFIYTIRDRGLTIAEMKGESSNVPVVRSVEGRAPFYLHGEDLAMINRNGKNIDHYANKYPKFDLIEEFKGHESVITCLSGWGDVLVSSGYDEKVFLWSLKSGDLLSTTPVKGCPNAMCVMDGLVILGCPDGTLLSLKATN